MMVNGEMINNKWTDEREIRDSTDSDVHRATWPGEEQKNRLAGHAARALPKSRPTLWLDESILPQSKRQSGRCLSPLEMTGLEIKSLKVWGFIHMHHNIISPILTQHLQNRMKQNVMKSWVRLSIHRRCDIYAAIKIPEASEAHVWGHNKLHWTDWRAVWCVCGNQCKRFHVF